MISVLFFFTDGALLFLSDSGISVLLRMTWVCVGGSERGLSGEIYFTVGGEQVHSDIIIFLSK